MDTLKKNKILLIYIEPTPYIVGLIKNIKAIFNDKIDVVFLKENASQPWNILLDTTFTILPTHWIKKASLIRKFFKINNYHLVHVAGWSESIFFWTLLFSKLYRVPISVESDTPLPFYIKKWKYLIKKWVYPRVFKRVNLFLPGGKRQAQYIESFGVKKERVVPVQMTVDVSAIQKFISGLGQEDLTRIRECYGIPHQHAVYLYVGRLENHKGVTDLIAAFQVMTNPRISLLIVGDGALRSLIENAAQIDKRIFYAGRLSDTALFEAYFASDVVILPSHFEPWGLVVNEAMAVGKPVIVSNRVGCIDDLVNTDTGLVVKAENVQELRDAMEWMITNTQQRIAMGDHAKKMIAHWTLEQEAHNMCVAWKQAGFFNESVINSSLKNT